MQKKKRKKEKKNMLQFTHKLKTSFLPHFEAFCLQKPKTRILLIILPILNFQSFRCCNSCEKGRNFKYFNFIYNHVIKLTDFA